MKRSFNTHAASFYVYPFLCEKKKMKKIIVIIIKKNINSLRCTDTRRHMNESAAAAVSRVDGLTALPLRR